jgi:hypothetical protein
LVAVAEKGDGEGLKNEEKKKMEKGGASQTWSRGVASPSALVDLPWPPPHPRDRKQKGK